MGATLQTLRNLQDIELQICDIQQQCARVERRLAAQQRKIDKIETEAGATRQHILREQIHFDRLDLEIKGRTANIDKLREHLNTVRTNKEYAVVLAQINNEKADTTKIESQALELMQAIETSREELAKHEHRLAEEQKRLSALDQELAETRDSFSARLTRLNGQKSEATVSVETGVVNLFNRIAERYEGEVMAEVLRPNPRRDEFRCGGCHMQLRAEVANSLKVHDDVQTCANCGRILYIDVGT
jgi:hypothetical protein